MMTTDSNLLASQGGAPSTRPLRILPNPSALRRGNGEQAVVLGFWLLVGQYLLATMLPMLIEGGRYTKVPQGVCLLGGFVLLAIGAFRLTDGRLFHASGFPIYFQVVLAALLVWGGVVILRSCTADLVTLCNLFFLPLNGSAWLVPLVAVCGAFPKVWRRLLPAMLRHLAIAMAAGVFWLAAGTRDSGYLYYGLPVLLTCFYYIGRSSRWLTVWGLVFFVVTAFLSGMRSVVMPGLFYIACVPVIGWMRNRGRDRGVVVVSTIVALCVTGIAYSVYFRTLELSFLPDRFQPYIEKFQDGGFKNTREPLYGEVWDDLSGNDLLIGRGALGTYFSPIYYAMHVREMANRQAFYENPGYREHFETAFHYMVLKGGFVMVILFYAATIPAVWLGLFSSHNWFARACALVVAEWLVMTFVYALPEVRLQYFMFWLAVGACWSRPIRQMSETDVQIMFAVLRPSTAPAPAGAHA